jgi:hypothetical protein
MNVDHLPGRVTVPSFGPKMVCTNAGPSAPMSGRIGGSAGRSGHSRGHPGAMGMERFNCWNVAGLRQLHRRR